eukprot:g60647.t1
MQFLGLATMLDVFLDEIATSGLAGLCVNELWSLIQDVLATSSTPFFPSPSSPSSDLSSSSSSSVESAVHDSPLAPASAPMLLLFDNDLHYYVFRQLLKLPEIEVFELSSQQPVPNRPAPRSKNTIKLSEISKLGSEDIVLEQETLTAEGCLPSAHHQRQRLEKHALAALTFPQVLARATRLVLVASSDRRRRALGLSDAATRVAPPLGELNLAQYCVLEQVAAARLRGVVQAQLCVRFQIGPADLFHMMKLLMRRQLVLRTQISETMFTNRIWLPRFVDPTQVPLRYLRHAMAHKEEAVAIKQGKRARNPRIKAEAEDEDDAGSSVMGCQIHANLSIRDQIYRLIYSSGQQGTTKPDLAAELGLFGKLINKEIDALCSDKALGLKRVSDYVGRAMTFRLFTHDIHHHKRRPVPAPSTPSQVKPVPDQGPVDPAAPVAAAPGHAPPTGVEMVDMARETSVTGGVGIPLARQQSAQSAATLGEEALDSEEAAAKKKRINAKKWVAENPISLALELRKAIARDSNSATLVDSRTSQRLMAQLERAKVIKILTVSTPRGSERLVVAPHLNTDDPEVQSQAITLASAQKARPGAELAPQLGEPGGTPAWQRSPVTCYSRCCEA